MKNFVCLVVRQFIYKDVVIRVQSTMSLYSIHAKYITLENVFQSKTSKLQEHDCKWYNIKENPDSSEDFALEYL